MFRASATPAVEHFAWRPPLSLFPAVGLTTRAPAQVVLDGTLGPAAGPLAGPDFQVTPDKGRQVGGNLFHSFGTFSLAAGESATFSGPASVQRVLTRVTGGSPSSIDGTLRCTIPDADFYFVNPAGVVFGPSARLNLDVQGSFAVTTADVINAALTSPTSARRARRSGLSVRATPTTSASSRPLDGSNAPCGTLASSPGRTLSTTNWSRSRVRRASSSSALSKGMGR